ncbi:hypothetical protein MASR2M15_15430 [Anaerolineales bacterium]
MISTFLTLPEIFSMPKFIHPLNPKIKKCFVYNFDTPHDEIINLIEFDKRVYNCSGTLLFTYLENLLIKSI